jgi:hypothetical protein
MQSHNDFSKVSFVKLSSPFSTMKTKMIFFFKMETYLFGEKKRFRLRKSHGLILSILFQNKQTNK